MDNAHDTAEEARREAHIEETFDAALAATFPASDPIAITALVEPSLQL